MADSRARHGAVVSAASGKPDPAEDGHEDDPVLDEVLDEVLVEDVSIDGMCGVY
jgi:mycofactocin precursor